jgi:hypothetical protein
MIAKAIKGRGFRGVLNYDLNEEKGEMLDTNMAGTNARELAQEFGAVRKLRPNLNKAVLHVSLSAAIGEHLTEDQWREIGHKYLKGMDLDNNQFVMTRHTDTDHEHIHIIANRIQFNGDVTSDSNDYRRQEVIMREIERNYGLQSVAPSADARRRAPTKGQMELEKRTGEIPARTQLQTIIDQATADKPPFLAFVNRLHSAEVSILPSGKTGTPQGISFEIHGQAFKGSDLGKSYAWKQLQARIDYEPNRDQGIIDQLRQDPSPAGMTTWNAAQQEAQAEQSAELERIKQAQAEEHAKQEQQAIKLIADYAEQARAEWRAIETGKIQAEAQKLRDDAQKRQANEPEKPALLGRKEWEKNHAELEADIRYANKKARELEESIGWRLSGENKNKFEYDGMQRLKKEHPDLYQVWRDARQARQQEQEQQKQARKTKQKSHDQDLEL